MSLKTKHIYEFGPFRLDADERLLFEGEEPVPLPPKVLDTLVVLVENNGHLVEKEELIKRVWPDTFVEENNLNKNVSALRKALGGGQDEGGKYIETIPKRGYRFIARVSAALETEAESISEDKAGARGALEADARVEDAPNDAPRVKHCPACQRTYSDAALNFCRADGTALVVGGGATIAAAPTTGLYDSRQSAEISKPLSGGMPPSIAVLPFVNMSTDAENDYFCDGLAEELLNALAKIEVLRVAARTSAFSFRGREVDVREIGRRLNVGTVLEGSVRKSGSRLRITAQLINAADGYHLWSERYDRQMEDIFDVQDEISLAIVDALKVRLLGDQQAALLKRYTDDTEAYHLYLKGRYFWNRRTEEGLRKSIEYYEQAITKDPSYAPAHVGLADSYNILARLSFISPDEARPKAKAAALKAVELDDALAEAHASLAVVLMDHDWDLPGAQREFERAIELQPAYSMVHQWYAVFFAAQGRMDEAVAEMRRAQKLDPLSLTMNMALGWMYYYARQYDQAIEHERKTLEMDENFPAAYEWAWAAYERQGRYDEAAEAVLKLRELQGADRREIAALREAYSASGWEGFMRKRLDALVERAQDAYVPPYRIAETCALLGNNDQAFEWLEKAYRERHFRLLFLKVEPRLDGLRSDPRFADLLRRTGLYAAD